MMDSAVFFSPRVVNTINSLPATDREAVASAIAGEFLLGHGATSNLTPLQALAVIIIRQYVRHDTAKIASGK